MSTTDARVILRIIEGSLTDRDQDVHAGESCLIGRGEEAQLRLQGDRTISHQHAVIEFQPPVCRIRNLSRTLATRVNGEQVTEAELHHGDVITLGQRVQLEVCFAS